MKRPFKLLRQHIIENLFRLFFILLFITISSCGDGYDGSETGSSDTGETGSYGFNLKWPDNVLTMESSSDLIQSDLVPAPINCTANGVETVAGDFYDESNNYLVGDSFLCSEHSGTIHDIDAGNNRRLVVTGENSYGHECFWAQRTGITIIADQTTVDDTEILMERLVSLFGSIGFEGGRGIAMDTNGNVYITGDTDGNLDGQANAGGFDIFVSKYDTNGNKLWTRLLGTSNYEGGFGIAADQGGNVYIIGWTFGNLDGNINAGGEDIFVSKYDANGNRLWTRLFGSTGDDHGAGIAVDPFNTVHITGYTFGNIAGTINMGGADIFYTRYLNDGTRLSTSLLGTSSNEFGTRIAADIHGNAYITGYTDGNLDGNTNAGMEDILVSKYDYNGNKLWTRLIGSTGDDHGAGIAVDTNGNSYITGVTGGNLDDQTNAGLNDIFVSKYDTNGTKQWTRLLGNPLRQGGWDITVDSNGKVYITGTIEGDLCGNTNAGGYDIFIWKPPSP